ncbi:MAG: multiheme c-type cytochrome [Candidatus Hydrothermarchaeota archaeon]
MKATKYLLFLALLTLLPLAVASPEEYVGAEKCKMCHKDVYEEWKESGHPYIIRTAEEAKEAGLPLPPGYTWDDISHVIGGYKWKARYLDKNGYFITKTKAGKNGSNQYNLETKTWSDYHPGEIKKYNCGKCHTTGYSPEGHMHGMEGIVGTWVYHGVQCEVCHGPGSEHIAKGGDKTLIIKDTSSALCGKCHIRGDKNTIPAKGGFIRHHEQYNELLASPKKDFECVACHDPHKKSELSIKVGCASCHAEEGNEFNGSLMQKAGVKCIDCHMAEAAKSAIARSTFQGDVKTHLFKINIDPDAKMFTEDGKFALGYLTVEYACLKCHTDKDKSWALKYAEGIHALKEVPKPPAPPAAKPTCGPTLLLLLASLTALLIGLKRRK